MDWSPKSSHLILPLARCCDVLLAKREKCKNLNWHKGEFGLQYVPKTASHPQTPMGKTQKGKGVWVGVMVVVGGGGGGGWGGPKRSTMEL